ncbi:hypothetical protein LTR56_005167 [Elasticomyces elasticus]|nr:hypothetical protein LTR56_005167 [Elasticomyces elasticus]KAK3659622.1 hypothetical protein LTR22_008353 [Elasticomyces elasticus]KAK5759663.1 hypothetical protein LTS12_010179 [Elasticomyces elasticus]
MEDVPGATIAVIGLGAHGLASLKNLLEEGFDATGFDSNDYVGGLWHATRDAKLSSLPTTVVNVSRERSCFTDFPFRDGTSSYPTAAQVDEYLNDYCTHFHLWSRLRLGTSITRIERDDEASKWRLRTSTSEGIETTLTFDKLVIATGSHSVPIMPSLAGSQDLEGDILHSLTYKDPEKFRNKTVVVVGMANTAVDTATGLVGVAKKVYLAHRNGCALLPRILNDGTSLDHGASYRTFAIRDVLETFFPKLAVKFIDNWVRQRKYIFEPVINVLTAGSTVSAIQKKHFDLDPQWRINTPPPSLSKQNPTVSDTLYPALRSGQIISTHAPKRVAGPRSIEMEDGTMLDEIDSVIFCTGYRLDLSYLGRYDPTLMSAEGVDPPQYDYNAPRLYQNILSHEHPESLAFIGMALIFFPGFVMADMNSMALAQLWKRPELMPTNLAMQEQYANHRAWRARINALPNTPGKGPQPLQVETGSHIQWVQEIVGTKLDEHLSYTSAAAWRLWWQDRQLSRLLYDGIYSPHAYRLFDSEGRRKKWDGAREAIVKVNEDIKRIKKDAELTTKVEWLPGDVVAHS